MGAHVFSARCSGFPLGVWSIGVAGGAKERPVRGGGAGPRTVVSRRRWPSGRSSDRTSSLGKSIRVLLRSAARPVGVESPGDAGAAPWADRALAYFRRQALTEPPVSGARPLMDTGIG